jgi:endoribonuclease L-PSP
VKALYEALLDVYPFPDDHRIFLREWPLDSVSQNGLLGSEPARPVLILHIPQGGDLDAKRTMLQRINAAVDDAYHLPDFVAFLHEHPLETVVINGGILADDQRPAGAHLQRPGCRRRQRQLPAPRRHGRTLRMSLNNLEALLGEVGMTHANVVRLNFYTTDMAALLQHFPTANERFESTGVRFATTLLGVTQLAAPDLLVAIEATAMD